MSNNSDLNPVVYDTEREADNDQIFRPNIDNMITDTADSRILTPASDVNYHSIDTRNNRKADPTALTRETESLRSIIDRLDNQDPKNTSKQNSKQAAKQNTKQTVKQDMMRDIVTLDSQESDIRSIVAEEYNKVLSTMRVDMVSIIQLLQTLHPKVNEQNGEIDNVKEDIYNLVKAVQSLRDRIEDANTLTIKRQQKYSAKIEDQITKMCSRLEALERANFTTREPVNREGQRPINRDQLSNPRSSQILVQNLPNPMSQNLNQTQNASQDTTQTQNQNQNQAQTQIMGQTRVQTRAQGKGDKAESKSDTKSIKSSQSTQEIYDALGNKRQNIRVKSKQNKATKAIKDQVGNNANMPTTYNSTSRMANRVDKHEDKVDQASIKASKMASRGLRDSVANKAPRKPRKDVINNSKSKKSKDKSDNSKDESKNSQDSDLDDSQQSSLDDNSSVSSHDESTSDEMNHEGNGKNIKVFKA